MSNPEVILRPSKTTNPKSLASAIAKELEKEANKKGIIIQAIGVGAVNQAVKALAIAGGFLGQRGQRIKCYTGFYDVTVKDRLDDDKITAIRFLLSLES